MSILQRDDVHLIDYLRILYKRRFFFIFVVAAALLSTAWSTSRTVKVYASTARILIDNLATIVNFRGVEQHQRLRLDTELHVMRSREVAEYAVENYLLPGVDRDEPEFQQLVGRLRGAISARMLPNTLIVDVRALTDEPEKARAWCDAMTRAYVDLNFETKKDINAAGAAAIREQIGENQRELQASERRMMDFKNEHNIVSEAAKAQKHSAIAGSTTAARVLARSKRIEAQNKYRALNRWYKSNQYTLPLPEDLAPSPLVMDLYADIAKKRTELKSLANRYKPKHPKVTALAADLKTQEQNFDGEIRASLAVLNNIAELNSNIESEHERVLEGDKRDFLKENERDWQYRVLERDVEVKEEINKALLTKLGEIGIAGSLVRNNVRVVDQPRAIPIPVRPNWKFNMLVGFAFGVAVAFGGVFFLEYLDKTLKTPDDIARYLELPVLAIVPMARADFLGSPYQAPQLRDGDAGALTS